MNSDEFDFSKWTDFKDYYAVTQSGDTRRVTLPRNLLPVIIYAITQTEGSEAVYDEVACEIANTEQCNYAEAWMKSMIFFQEKLDDKFTLFLSNVELRREAIDTFFRIQTAREQRWRRKHKEWRQDLPPALD